MRSVIHNYQVNKQSINLGSESLALRCAYVLSDAVLSTGTSYAFICYDHYFRSMSPENKIRAMEAQSPEEFAKLGAGTADQMINMLKLHKKVKHPVPGQIIAFKKLEKSINTLWEFDHQENLARMMLTGMPQLEPLMKDENFLVLSVHSVQSELNDKYFYPCSKIMNLDFEEDDAIDLFFLPMEFITYVETQSIPRSHKPFFTEHLFMFPNVNSLSSEELKAVRSSLSSETAPFRSKVDEWVKACAKDSPGQTRNFFDKEIKPLAATIQQKMEQNQLLQYVDKHYENEKPRIEVVGGEVCLSVIWAFYHALGIIPDETWKMLEALNTTEKAGERRVPVLINKMKKESKGFFSKLKELKEEIVLPTRKTLDID
ncbi:MAG: hypothetical protein AB7G44_16580 [Bacteroidia bacterium]